MGSSSIRDSVSGRQRGRGLQKTRGQRIGTILSGAWRPVPPPLDLASEELNEVAPLLLASGGAALAWWRVRSSPIGSHPAARSLRRAHRLQTLQAPIHEGRIVRALGRLRAAGLESVLLKGGAASRLYPHPGLRPYGDIDLLVPPEQSEAARAALDMSLGDAYPVDLHQDIPGLDRTWRDLLARSRWIQIAGVETRTLGAEDELRLLCVHAFRETIWRPLWLCDIAAALEGLPADFDWDYCVAGTVQSAEWITFAALLAHRLLGANLDGVPPAWTARELPRWLPPAVFRQWGSPEYYMHSASVALTLGSPTLALRSLALRWPNPLLATVTMDAPFNNFPRLPYQLAECASRAFHFARRLAGSFS